MTPPPADLADRLAGVGRRVRDALVERRGDGALREVVGSAGGDDLFGADRVADAIVLDAFADLGHDYPGSLIMEGFDEPLRVGSGAEWTFVVDPVDGSRPWLAGKRSAWVLLAGGRGASTLDELELAVAVEIPPTVHHPALVMGGGTDLASWLVRDDLASGATTRLAPPRPDPGESLERRFVTVARFAPGLKGRIGEFEDRALAGLEVYEDPYLCSGGQMLGVALGNEAAVIDPRPLFAGSMSAHPYDLCLVPAVRACGVIVESVPPGPLDYPLDVTTSCAWAAYANEAVAAQLRPRIEAALVRSSSLVPRPTASRSGPEAGA